MTEEERQMVLEALDRMRRENRLWGVILLLTGMVIGACLMMDW
jgi:hypothetical protein